MSCILSNFAKLERSQRPLKAAKVCKRKARHPLPFFLHAPYKEVWKILGSQGHIVLNDEIRNFYGKAKHLQSSIEIQNLKTHEEIQVIQHKKLRTCKFSSKFYADLCSMSTYASVL